jgi:beta-mannosidase
LRRPVAKPIEGKPVRVFSTWLAAGLAASAVPAAAASWTVRVEEPTGLYPRTNEVVRVPLDRIAGHQGPFVVTDAEGNELPWQVGGGELLFPATLIPGELPEYRIIVADSKKPRRFKNSILLRKVGLNRVELGNSRFRVMIDTRVPAIIEAYSLAAGPQRALNCVETTPENPDSLKDDMYADTYVPPPRVPGVEGENIGWTSLGGSEPMTEVQLVERGPLRGKLRLKRGDETWEFTWQTDSAALRWKARKGFLFTAVSAEPYLPFDRCVGGSEYEWPSGPEQGEPPDHEIAPRDWKKLPGGHAVYYHAKEDYGALGIVALDPDLNWTGIGSRRFKAEKTQGNAEIAITFPFWRASQTVLEARRENRVLRQPLVILVTQAKDGDAPIQRAAEEEPAAEFQTVEAPPTPFPPDALSLDGAWELAWCEKGDGPPKAGWRTVQVPGTAHGQWLDPSKIYTREAEWVSRKEWWYRKAFQPPPRFTGKRLRLQFDATDYYADVWLNRTLLGRHEGYMDPFAFDVADRVRVGQTNQLLVRVWTPVHYYWKHRPYTIKGSYGGVDQKPDDITALGLTRSVRLVAAEPVIIQDLAVDTRLTGDHSAEVAVDVVADREPEGECFWEATLSPRNFSSKEHHRIRVPATAHSTQLVIPIQNPQLWWTWDHGRPNLYTLDVRLVDADGKVLDARSLAVGIREIEKVGWVFYLNRKRLFIRGTNYYYHLYMSEMDRAAYERDLKLMLQMNVNLIRLHCHFSNREFYDLADELGVLVWQDFLEAWYPHDRAFSLRAAALYDPLIRTVRNHPCIALWTTSDEEDLENYRDLTKHLAPRPALLDPQRRPVVRSTARYGDAHVYEGWYGGTIWAYAKMTQAFVSELGATALPNYEMLLKFMPDAWPIRGHADEWTWRRLQIKEALRAWGDPGNQSLKEYIPQTQAYVARLFQLALERSRRLKYQPAGGILHFHAIDIWPSVTMAAIDFERVPTKVFHTVRRSFAPVAALFEYDRARWKPGREFQCGLWAVNDRWQAVPNTTIRWRIVDRAGALQATGEWRCSLPEDSVQKLGDVKWTVGQGSEYELRAEILGADGQAISENVFEFSVGE